MKPSSHGLLIGLLVWSVLYACVPAQAYDPYFDRHPRPCSGGWSGYAGYGTHGRVSGDQALASVGIWAFSALASEALRAQTALEIEREQTRRAVVILRPATQTTVSPPASSFPIGHRLPDGRVASPWSSWVLPSAASGAVLHDPATGKAFRVP